MTPNVRVDPQFFTELDAQLGESRGPNGEPYASDFLLIDLPSLSVVVVIHETAPDRLIRSETLVTERLELRPLRPDDAIQMTETLSDPAIYEYIGGEPPTEAELRSRYEFLAGQRSPDGTQSWLNWIVRERATSTAVGVMQATVLGRGKADVAWTIAPLWQGRGYASEAAVAIVTWLSSRSVEVVTAHIHPEHEASRRVAEAAGLEETGCVNNGEQRWERHLISS